MLHKLWDFSSATSARVSMCVFSFVSCFAYPFQVPLAVCRDAGVLLDADTSVSCDQLSQPQMAASS